MPPEGRPGPFTELLARTIAEQSLSLAQVAKRVDQQAEKDGVRLATTKQQVFRWRRGPQVPEPQMVRWLATALDRPVEEFAVAAQQQLLEDVRSQARVPPRRVVPAECLMASPTAGRTGELAELRARLLESEDRPADRLSPSTGHQGSAVGAGRPSRAPGSRSVPRRTAVRQSPWPARRGVG